MTESVVETLTAHASHWLRRLDSIRTEVMTTPEAEFQPVSDEQLERLRAIAMREER